MSRQFDNAIRSLGGAEAVNSMLAAAADLFPAAEIGMEIHTQFADPQSFRIHTNTPHSTAQVAEFLRVTSAVPTINATMIRLNHEGISLTYNYGDGLLANLNLSVQQQRTLSDIAKLLTILGKHFTLTSKQAIIGEAYPAEIQQRIRYAETTMQALTDAVARIGQIALEQTTRQSEYLDRKQVELDRRFQEKTEQAEAGIKKQSEKLAEREAAIADKIAKLGESRHVRRTLLEEIEKKIVEKQATAALSPETIEKRKAIHALCLIVLTLSAALIGFLVRKIMAMPVADWHYFAPLGAAIFLFVGTLIYYLRWNDAWFRDHADVEFRNMRFSADIMRASWIAELLFEWEKERKENPLPPVVIDSFTRDLFRDERPKRIIHPAESVLGAIGKFRKVKVGNVELSDGKDKG